MTEELLPRTAVLDDRDRLIRHLYLRIERLEESLRLARAPALVLEPRVIECSGGKRVRVRARG